MAERKGSCNSEAGEFTRKSGAPALRRKGSRRRRHDATQRAESLLLSTEKQNGQAKMLVRFVGGTNKVQVELKVDSIKIIINIRQMRKNLT